MLSTEQIISRQIRHVFLESCVKGFEKCLSHLSNDVMSLEGETMTARPLFNATLSKVTDTLQGLCCHQQVVQPRQLPHQYHGNHKHVITVITFHKHSPGNYWLFDIG